MGLGTLYYTLIYKKGMVWCSLCGFLIIKLQIALHHAVWCGAMRYIVTCGVVRLCHFSSSFDAIFAVWWTLLCIRNCCQKLTMIIYIYIYIYMKTNDVSNFIKIVTRQPLRIVNPHFGSIFLHNSVQFYQSLCDLILVLFAQANHLVKLKPSNRNFAFAFVHNFTWVIILL